MNRIPDGPDERREAEREADERARERMEADDFNADPHDLDDLPPLTVSSLERRVSEKSIDDYIRDLMEGM